MGVQYGKNKIYQIQLLYLIAAIVWLLLVVYFELYSIPNLLGSSGSTNVNSNDPNDELDSEQRRETKIRENFSYCLMGYGILAIPLVIFFLSFISVKHITVEIEKNSYLVNYISIGLIVIVPILTLAVNQSDARFNAEKGVVINIIILALIFTILAVLDVWVRPKWLSIIKHLRSIFQTLSLSLILFALYIYFGFFSSSKSSTTKLPTTKLSTTKLAEPLNT